MAVRDSSIRDEVAGSHWNLRKIMEAEGGIEPPYTALQAAA
jgi:hypothetical protein